MNDKFLTVVTINLNNAEGLEKTIKSVINQTYFDKIHFVIIDGKSTDGSVDIIKQYADDIDFWCSEQDKGIFNAMNKGIDHLNGDYVLFLNSGDFLHNNKVIEDVYDKLDADIVYGNEVMFAYLNQGMVKYTSLSACNKWVSKYPDVLNEQFFKKSALPHQSTFIKTSLHKQHKYDETCIIAGDWKFTREAILKYGATYKHIPMIISNYETTGISAKQYKTFVKEKENYYKDIEINE